MSLDRFPDLMPLPKEFKWEYSQDTACNNSMVCRFLGTDIWYMKTAVPIIEEELTEES